MSDALLVLHGGTLCLGKTKFWKMYLPQHGGTLYENTYLKMVGLKVTCFRMVGLYGYLLIEGGTDHSEVKFK